MNQLKVNRESFIAVDALPQRENQTAGEMHRLASEVNMLVEKINILEQRLSPLMSSPPGSIGDNEKDIHVVPLASEIRENRYIVERANQRLNYILENIQI